MSKLDDILRHHMRTCFLVTQVSRDQGVELMARQNVVSRQKIKDLLLDLVGEEPKYRSQKKTYQDGYQDGQAILIKKIRMEVEKL